MRVLNCTCEKSMQLVSQSVYLCGGVW